MNKASPGFRGGLVVMMENLTDPVLASILRAWAKCGRLEDITV